VGIERNRPLINELAQSVGHAIGLANGEWRMVNTERVAECRGLFGAKQNQNK